MPLFEHLESRQNIVSLGMEFSVGLWNSRIFYIFKVAQPSKKEEYFASLWNSGLNKKCCRVFVYKQLQRLDFGRKKNIFELAILLKVATRIVKYRITVKTQSLFGLFIKETKS